MKNLALIFLSVLTLVSCTNAPVPPVNYSENSLSDPVDTSDNTNNFYDNTETFNLPVDGILIEGEVANPGKVNLSSLPVRSVIVKETLLDTTGGDRFVGAYRYNGYSLFDILNISKLNKANSAEFNPVIDLYIEVENRKGEKVVFSWGEIYYPNNLHKILIAGSVSRIVPSKTKDLWPLPETCKLIAGSDLVTERNISDPVKITVKSIHRSFQVARGMSPLYSEEFKLFSKDKILRTVGASAEKETTTYNTIFYGRGKGIHSTLPFTGIPLKDILKDDYPMTRGNIRNGMFCLVGVDGYRCAVSFSELLNRNDQQEFLLVRTEPGEDGGLYRILAACDFFSDRSIKSLSEIHIDF